MALHPEAGLSLQLPFKAAIYSDPFTLALSSRRVGADSRDEDAELRRAQAYDWISRGTDPEENDKRPLGSFGRVASRMNCRYRAPVPFTPLVATVLLASQSIGSRCDREKASHQAISPDSSGRDQRLDQHRFRSLGKLVVGNLDRIADVDNVGN